MVQLNTCILGGEGNGSAHSSKSFLSLNSKTIIFPSEDINECQEKVCSHVCVNTQGSFRCTCPAGMILRKSQTKCERKTYNINIYIDFWQINITKLTITINVITAKHPLHD